MKLFDSFESIRFLEMEYMLKVAKEKVARFFCYGIVKSIRSAK